MPRPSESSGFSVTEALGASVKLIIPERFRVRHWAGWEGTMATGVTRYGEGQMLAVPALHKDGRQISIESSIQLLKDPGGQIGWVVAIVRHVTERFLREKERRAQVKAVPAKTTGQPQERRPGLIADLDRHSRGAPRTRVKCNPRFVFRGRPRLTAS
jgi:PAS domain S-box-containing protein